MPRFSIRNPYFIVVICLALAVVGVNALSACRGSVPAHQPAGGRRSHVLQRHAAAGYRGGYYQSTRTLFTQASGVDHMESRSLLGVSIIKVYFQPGTDADSDVTQLSNLALADLNVCHRELAAAGHEIRCLQFAGLPGTVKGEGLNETQLHDLAQFQIRNQIAVVKGAEIPAVFGGKYRQAMIYVDPLNCYRVS